VCLALGTHRLADLITAIAIRILFLRKISRISVMPRTTPQMMAGNVRSYIFKDHMFQDHTDRIPEPYRFLDHTDATRLVGHI